MSEQTGKSVLAIYPSSKGFGWAFWYKGEDGTKKWESGFCGMDKPVNAKAISHISTLMDIYRPLTIVTKLESRFRSKRMAVLAHDIMRMAESRNLIANGYSREQIRFVFSQFGVQGKGQIASLIHSELPDFRLPEPVERPVCGTEPRLMNRYDAVSLIITHEYLNG